MQCSRWKRRMRLLASRSNAQTSAGRTDRARPTSRSRSGIVPPIGFSYAVAELSSTASDQFNDTVVIGGSEPVAPGLHEFGASILGLLARGVEPDHLSADSGHAPVQVALPGDR